MSGRNVATIFNQVTRQDQQYRINFDGTSLSNGIYIYRLTSPNEVLVDKFIIAR
jgi:hypothetical protein